MTRAKRALPAAVVLALTVLHCHTEKAVLSRFTDDEVVVPHTQRMGALRVDVCLDATPSMAGFATNPNSVYLRFLDELEAAVKNSLAASSVHYFKFGEAIREMSREEFRAARTQPFYREPGMFKATDIELVFRREAAAPPADDADRVALVVTDLFQRDQDVNAVTDAIREHCLQKRCSVGVLPVPSQFDGLVYDARVAAFPYRSAEGKPDTYRPFYVLMFGEQSRIEQLVEILAQKEYVRRDRFLLIGPKLVNSYTLTLKKAAREEGRFLNLEKAVADTFHFALKRNGSGGFFLVDGLEVERCAGCPEFDAKGIELQALAGPRGAAKNTSDLTLEKFEQHQGKYSARLRFNTAAATGEHPYQLLFRVRKLAPFAVPPWVKELSSDDPRPDADSAKTMNLRLFVERLLDANASINQPPIAKAYLVVRKLG